MTWLGKRRTFKCLSAMAVAGAVLIVAAPWVKAQVALRARQVVRAVPDGVDGNEQPNEGIFVHESEEAAEKLHKAAEMERAKEWIKSADFYQEVLQKYRDRVIPAQKDADGRVYQYTSIANSVQQRLSKWPSEGLDVYRARYETPADALFEGGRTGDIDTLNRVFTLYFVTDSGKRAGIRLMDLYLERGEFLAAATLGDRLLDWHPNLIAERASVLYRTGLAYHLAGLSEKADARLARLAKDHPADRGVVRGKDVLLAESLRDEMRISPSGATLAGADSWPMFGGSPDRGRVSAAAGRPGARLFSIPLSKPSWASASAQQKAIVEQNYRAAVERGATIGVMPVVDRGQLFFQDGQRLYAVSLDSGLPLPGWAQTYNGGVYSISNYWGSARTRQLTLTLTDRSVIGIMGHPDHQSLMMNQTPQGEARLVCLDRETGKENWNSALSQLPDEVKNQRTLQLSGSPLVVGDNVLVIGRASKQAQFEDCYVFSFDLNSGKFRWSCYIASANVAGAMWGMQPMLLSDNASHPAYANGRVFVQTNLGALAALDAYSGTIVWLNLYPTNTANIDPNQGGFNPFIQQQQSQQNARHKPWEFNPVVVSQGKVFTLPTDGKYLLIYDAQSGTELKRLRIDDLRDKDSRGCETMLGVVGNRLLVSGEEDVLCVDWEKYDAEAADRQSAWVWPQTLPQPIRGRGFLTTDSVFVPAEDRLYRIDLTNGKTIGAYPNWPRTWEEGEGPGNVLVTSDHVIMAGARAVNVYTDLALARAKLDREAADSPLDAQSRLRYAEVMFVAGEPDTAIAKLDDAIKLLGGAAAIQDVAARDRVFHDALTFAQKLAADDRPEMRLRAAQLFDRAGAVAATPLQQVSYRLDRARFDVASKQPAEAVRLYQEILSDARLRTVPLVDDSSPMPSRADAEAESQIAALIKNDPASYAPFEQAAAEALRQAQQGGGEQSAPKLMAVAQAYPNSNVAAQAMLQAAEAYEAAGNPRMANQAIRQLYWKTPANSPNRPRIIEMMARNYLAMPHQTDSAAARLAQAAAVSGELKLSKPLRLPDGRLLENVTFNQALEEVRKYSGREAARALPDFHLPVPPTVTGPGTRRKWPRPFLEETPDSAIPDTEALLEPIREFARADRLVTWTTGGKLQVTVPGGQAPVVSIDGLAEEPARCAWLNAGLLVCGATRASLVNPDQAKVLWTLDVKQLQPIEVVHAGEAPEQIRPNPNGNMVIGPNGQVFFRPNGRLGRPGMAPMVAVNPPAAQPKVPPGAEQIADARPVGDRLLMTTSTGRLLSADLATGAVAWQTRLSEQPIDRMAATDDFTVVKISDDSTVRLAAFDTFTGKMLGSKSFVKQNGMVPVNLALSPDGTLVYTLPDRLCLKNLYTPWPDSSDREVQGPAGLPPFNNASGPDQLVIAEGRILALADNGTEKYVRVHSLETGNALPLKVASPQGDQEVDRVLGAGKSWNVALRVVGPHLYVVSPEGVTSYNLDRPAETWTSVVPDTQLNVRNMFIGQQYLVLIDDQTPPANGGAPPQPSFGLRAFGLYPASSTNPAESGRLDYRITLSDPAGLTGAWQAVDGGFVYLTADHKLHLLRGARESH